ncbi:hypothetical protein IIB97_02015 [Patescibacteria group bacterium]|nr:hypothetical protein [Patescibacteria group bacterium]
MEIKFYKEAAAGGWLSLSFEEQMGNIGSEVGRVAQWKGESTNSFENAVQRALELFELTLKDERWGERLKDVAKMKEVFCSAVADDSNRVKLTLEELDRKLLPFAIAARKDLTF